MSDEMKALAERLMETGKASYNAALSHLLYSAHGAILSLLEERDELIGINEGNFDVSEMFRARAELAEARLEKAKEALRVVVKFPSTAADVARTVLSDLERDDEHR